MVPGEGGNIGQEAVPTAENVALELTQVRVLMARSSGLGGVNALVIPPNLSRTLTVQPFGWMDTSIVEPRRAASCGAPD